MRLSGEIHFQAAQPILPTFFIAKTIGSHFCAASTLMTRMRIRELQVAFNGFQKLIQEHFSVINAPSSYEHTFGITARCLDLFLPKQTVFSFIPK
jgi:hypothetical protein